MLQGADKIQHVTISTDGGAAPNPGAGGYGVILRYGEHEKELSGGFRKTTNNRMELMAAIVGLEALKKKCRVTLRSDSEYLVRSLETRSAFKWRDHNWWRSANNRAKNTDLWERLLDVYERHEVSLVWVRGHTGDPDNERCDQLATEALNRDDLPIDREYEAPKGDTPTCMQEGDPCLKCKSPLAKRVPNRKHRPGQTHYYEYYLYCSNCQATVMVDDGKRDILEYKPDLPLFKDSG